MICGGRLKTKAAYEQQIVLHRQHMGRQIWKGNEERMDVFRIDTAEKVGRASQKR